MSGVLLHDYDVYDRWWLLDPGSGRAARAPPGCRTGSCTQADARRWDVRDLEFSYDFDLDGQVSLLVIAGGAAVIDASYPGPLADPVNRADPALDALDIEGQDFFYYLFVMQPNPDWLAGVLPHWGEGMRPSTAVSNG